MPIPKVKDGQTEQEYVSDCISQTIDEYGQEQSAAICYNTYREETKMSGVSKIASKLRELGVSPSHTSAYVNQMRIFYDELFALSKGTEAAGGVM